MPTARRAGIPFPRYACRHPPRVAVRITLSVYRAARVALRTMKIAIILDPLDRIKTYKDTTYAMMVEAASRGHELHMLMQDGVMWKHGRVIGESCRLELTGDSTRW